MKLAAYCHIFFMLALSGLSIGADPAEDGPMPLAVVHTRAELMAQKPVTLTDNGDPVTYRLGIDSTDAKLYGGVILYCLAESGKPTHGGQSQIGPFQVDVQTPKAAVDRQIAEQIAWGSAGDAKQIKELLYTKTISFGHAGDYTITLKEPLGDPKTAKFEPVAMATIKVSNESGPLWSPWPLNAAEGAIGLLARDSVDDRSSSAEGVANPATGVAIPRMFEWMDTGADPDLRLPQLFPPEPDPGVKLQANGSLLLVTLDHGIQPQFPDEKFLSRWWINGKPFSPKLDAPQFSMNYGMRHNGMMQYGFATNICFQVEFHPEILGAKKGDEIGVQLLLCPQGYENSGPSTQLMMAMTDINPNVRDYDSLKPRMSNRVTFTYTGDPVRMAPMQ